MTISSATGASASPLQRLLSTISSQASAGSISSADASALSEATTDIDSTLRSGRSTGGSARLSPGDAKSRIESLIDGQVEKGTLTGDQASTLKDIFSQNAPSGAGGARGFGGPPPELPSDDEGDTTATGLTSASTSDSTLADLLQGFLEQLRGNQTDASGYASGGASSTSGSSGSRFSALLIDYQA